MPFDFDIFSPACRPHQRTEINRAKRNLPGKVQLQHDHSAQPRKNKMSYPVINKRRRDSISQKSAVSSGHPNVENGHSPELNHVSSTSGSCRNFVDPHLGHLRWIQPATRQSLRHSPRNTTPVSGGPTTIAGKASNPEYSSSNLDIRSAGSPESSRSGHAPLPQSRVRLAASFCRTIESTRAAPQSCGFVRIIQSRSHDR